MDLWHEINRVDNYYTFIYHYTYIHTFIYLRRYILTYYVVGTFYYQSKSDDERFIKNTSYNF